MMNNLDIKTLNIQELDSREMTMHNGGDFGDACLGGFLVGFGAMCLVSAIKTVAAGIRLLLIHI